MNPMQQQPSPATLQKSLRDNLMKAKAARGDLSAQLESVNKQIDSMVNALEGIELGKKLLQEEIDAAAAKAAAAETTPNGE